jgi:hypothetical protein
MYVKSGSGETIKIGGEYDVVLPAMPIDHEIINYELPSKDQKYRRFVFPNNFSKLSFSERDDIASQLWHRRLNGEWQFINGRPYYIPGGATMFFDFWHMQSGRLPDFRWEALEFFLLWYLFVEPNSKVFGLYDVKPRRVGDTEKALFLVYEGVTRFKNTRGGLQSYTDEEAKENFKRMAYAHSKMIEPYKPLHKGYDIAADTLLFQPPSKLRTANNLSEDLTQEGHGGMIDYQATVVGKYDGRQLFRYHMDEALKIKTSKMDVV